MGFGYSRSKMMSLTRATGRICIMIIRTFFYLSVNDLIGVYLILGVQDGAFNR